MSFAWPEGIGQEPDGGRLPSEVIGVPVSLPSDTGTGLFMAIIAIKDSIMRSVNVAELKNRLSTYLAYARNGEVIVIRDRNLPVAD
jgi:hypothetical protein